MYQKSEAHCKKKKKNGYLGTLQKYWIRIFARGVGERFHIWRGCYTWWHTVHLHTGKYSGSSLMNKAYLRRTKWNICLLSRKKLLLSIKQHQTLLQIWNWETEKHSQLAYAMFGMWNYSQLWVLKGTLMLSFLFLICWKTTQTKKKWKALVYLLILTVT